MEIIDTLLADSHIRINVDVDVGICLGHMVFRIAWTEVVLYSIRSISERLLNRDRIALHEYQEIIVVINLEAHPDPNISSSDNVREI